MKRVVLALMSFFSVPTAYSFVDVSVEDPHYSTFHHLREVNIMHPYEDGSFHPEKIVTRAEALAVALRAGGIAISSELSPEQIPFGDVDPNAWYAPVVARGLELEMINASRPTFRPHQAITKAEFLAFLFRTTLVDLRPYTRTKGNHLALDIPDEAWFVPHFAYAKKYQIAHFPPDQHYRPAKVLNRREVALMTYRQLRLFYGNDVTKYFLELQAQIQQFMSLLRAGEPDKAEFHLQRILELQDQLARTKNNADAVSAHAISQALTHFSESLRAFGAGKILNALENIHLAAKQTQRAATKSETMKPFARELSLLLGETLLSFTQPTNYLSAR